MNILLTGGEGFIGRNIKESFLNEKYNIFAPSMNQLDLQNEKDVEAFILSNKINVVIHSAAKAGHRNAPDPTGIFYSNTRMFFSIARNIDYLDKILVMGSGAIYDQRYYKDCMEEEYADQNLPLDEHGLSKYVINKYISGVENNKIIDLRIFGIFGKYEDYAIRFISNMCCKAIYDINLTMNQNRLFSYLYIDDLMPVLEYFIDYSSNFKCYNVVPEQTHDLYSLAERVLEISGKKLDIVVKNNGMGSSYTGDSSRLYSEIKELHFIGINESIEKLYRWYYDNKHLVNKNLLVTDK